MGKCFSIKENKKTETQIPKPYQLNQNIIISNTDTEIQIEKQNEKQILKSVKKKQKNINLKKDF